MDKIKYISIALCVIAIILFIIASNIKIVILGFILIIIAIFIHKYAISSMKNKIIEEEYKKYNK